MFCAITEIGAGCTLKRSGPTGRRNNWRRLIGAAVELGV
jgi:hypothetical protein